MWNAKWLVFMAIAILFGAVALGLSFSGALDPVKNAAARAEDAKTKELERQIELQRQRDAINLQTEQSLQQITLDTAKQQAAADAEYKRKLEAKQLELLDQQKEAAAKQQAADLTLTNEKIESERQRREKELAQMDERHAQEMAQAAQWTSIAQGVLYWGGRVMAAGIAIAWVIIASGLTVYLVFRAVAPVLRAMRAENSKIHSLLLTLGRVNNSLRIELAMMREKLVTLGRVNNDLSIQLTGVTKEITNLETRMTRTQGQIIHYKRALFSRGEPGQRTNSIFRRPLTRKIERRS